MKAITAILIFWVISAPAWAGCDTRTIEGKTFSGSYSGELAGMRGPHKCRRGRQVEMWWLPGFEVQCKVRKTRKWVWIGTPRGGYGGVFSLKSNCNVRSTSGGSDWYFDGNPQSVRGGRYDRSSKRLTVNFKRGRLDLRAR